MREDKLEISASVYTKAVGATAGTATARPSTPGSTAAAVTAETTAGTTAAAVAMTTDFTRTPSRKGGSQCQVDR